MAYGNLKFTDVTDSNGSPLMSLGVELSGEWDQGSNAHQQINLVLAYLDSINKVDPDMFEPTMAAAADPVAAA